MARRFADSFKADDIEGVIELLTDDAWLAMPPAPHEYVGRVAIASFLRASARWRGKRRLELVPTRANNQPAYCCYVCGSEAPAPYPAGILVLTLSGNRISALTRFLDDTSMQGFGPDPRLDGRKSPR